MAEKGTSAALVTPLLPAPGTPSFVPRIPGLGEAGKKK